MLRMHITLFNICLFKVLLLFFLLCVQGEGESGMEQEAASGEQDTATSASTAQQPSEEEQPMDQDS